MNWASRAASGLIRLYQLTLSPWLGNQCRFYPTCSAYGLESYRRHGFLKGSFLTVTRICNCHPYSRRPWTDPVPERFAWGDMFRYNRPEQKTEQKTNTIVKD